MKKLDLKKLQQHQGVRTGNPNKCCVPNCHNDSYYDSPDYLCSNHWVQWWVDGLGCSSQEEYNKICQDILSLPDIRQE